MDEPLNYRYWKWVDDPDDDNPDRVKGVFREVIFKITLQQFWLGGWRDAFDLMMRAWEDPEFVEIDEAEAEALYPILWEKQKQKVAFEGREPSPPYSFVCEGRQETPLGSMVTAAVALHEFYISFTAAGFTEDQAMQLVRDMLNKPKEPSEEV